MTGYPLKEMTTHPSLDWHTPDLINDALTGLLYTPNLTLQRRGHSYSEISDLGDTGEGGEGTGS